MYTIIVAAVSAFEYIQGIITRYYLHHLAQIQRAREGLPVQPEEPAPGRVAGHYTDEEDIQQSNTDDFWDTLALVDLSEGELQFTVTA